MTNRFLYRKPSLRQNPLIFVVLLSVISMFVLLALNIDPERTLLLVGLACGVITVTTIALRYPKATIVLLFVTGMILFNGANSLLPAALRNPSLGSLSLRYFDPVLLGIVLALLIRLLFIDRRLFKGFILKQPALSLLLVWLIADAFLSSAKYGLVASLGEFRTYDHCFLIVPYIVSSFKTREEQWRLFKLLLILGLLLIPWSLISALLTPNLALFDFSGDFRFISSYVNLALLCTVVGLYVAERQGALKIKSFWFRGLLLLFAFITLVNSHRSVWLATAVAFVLLFLFRRLSSRQLLDLGLAVVLLGLALALAPPRFTQPVIGQFQKRTTAFTDYREDSTAYWRYYLWLQAIKDIQEHPISGVGLGKDFQFYGPGGNLITTSPHNAYITLSHQSGLTALVLYLLFILRTSIRLLRSIRDNRTLREKTIMWTVLIVMVTASAYYLAYSMDKDFFTWLIIGLGVAVLANSKRQDHGSS